jgi:hypothetical protein
MAISNIKFVAKVGLLTWSWAKATCERAESGDRFDQTATHLLILAGLVPIPQLPKPTGQACPPHNGNFALQNVWNTKVPDCGHDRVAFVPSIYSPEMFNRFAADDMH